MLENQTDKRHTHERDEIRQADKIEIRHLTNFGREAIYTAGCVGRVGATGRLAALSARAGAEDPGARGGRVSCT